MNNKFHSRGLSVAAPHLIINQITSKDIVPIEDPSTINLFKSGLSLSRNCALKNSSSDICLISDDDLMYEPNFDKKIIEVFEKYPRADIITFKILKESGVEFKNYKKKPFYHNMKSVMRVASVEIAFRRASIINDLEFDERFGLGAQFPSSEENIFLTDALKKGKTILFYPLVIATHPDVSSGSNYQNPRLAKAKGAMLYRIFSSKSYLLCLAFAVKHYTKTPYTLKAFTQELISGALEYRGLMKKKSKNNYN